MRLIDLKCATCDVIRTDHLERDVTTPRPVCCGVPMERVHLPTQRGSVIGDEIDVWVRNGLCNADGTPRHFTSRSDLRKAEQKAGQTNYVRHVGSKGSDKNKHTTRWT